MKKNFLLLCAVLLIMGCLLPFASYKLTRAVLARASANGEAASSAPNNALGGETPGSLFAAGEDATLPASEADAEIFYIQNQSTGQVEQVARRDYIIGSVAAEMPVSWPDEALKAQAVASHSYALYCRDHNAQENGAWLSADPVRRQGWLDDNVLRSYWGTNYEANYARLSAIVDEVLTHVLYYDGAPAGTSYFAISNGRTETSADVWGAALPYLVSVDSGLDTAADNYEYTLTLSAEQMRQYLSSGLGISADVSALDSWFGEAQLTPAGYVKTIIVCGQAVSGTALRRALGLRSTCFEISRSGDNFSITTRGYGHGVGLSQWGAKGMAEQGKNYREILAHYFPGTEMRG